MYNISRAVLVKKERGVNAVDILEYHGIAPRTKRIFGRDIEVFRASVASITLHDTGGDHVESLVVRIVSECGSIYASLVNRQARQRGEL